MVAKGKLFKPGATIWTELAIEPTVSKPDSTVLNCSFCGAVVSNAQATRGTAKAPGMINLIRVDEVRRTFEDRKVPKAEKVIACPNCSLKVERVKFPDFD